MHMHGFHCMLGSGGTAMQSFAAGTTRISSPVTCHAREQTAECISGHRCDSVAGGEGEAAVVAGSGHTASGRRS